MIPLDDRQIEIDSIIDQARKEVVSRGVEMVASFNLIVCFEDDDRVEIKSLGVGYEAMSLGAMAKCLWDALKDGQVAGFQKEYHLSSEGKTIEALVPLLKDVTDELLLLHLFMEEVEQGGR
jgi:hypothetical protein